MLQSHQGENAEWHRCLLFIYEYNQNTTNCTAPRLSVQHCQPLDDQFATAPPLNMLVMTVLEEESCSGSLLWTGLQVYLWIPCTLQIYTIFAFEH